MNNMTYTVQNDLQHAGMTRFGLLKFASRRLAHILHEGEHVRGVVYGRYAQGQGLMRLNEGMLVATDRRILFIDRKPGFEAIDELTYQIVFGVKKVYAWPFSAMTLHTRVGNYTIRYANSGCVDTFMRYVEARQLENSEPQIGSLSCRQQILP